MTQLSAIDCPFCGAPNDPPGQIVLESGARRQCPHQLASFLAGSIEDMAEYFGIDVTEWQPQDRSSFQAYLRPRMRERQGLLFAPEGERGLQAAIMSWLAERER